MRNENEAT